MPIGRSASGTAVRATRSASAISNAPPSADEIIYLCDAVNRYFRLPVSPDEVVWAYAGVRPLHDDGSKKPEDVTRIRQSSADAALLGEALMRTDDPEPLLRSLVAAAQS